MLQTKLGYGKNQSFWESSSQGRCWGVDETYCRVVLNLLGPELFFLL